MASAYKSAKRSGKFDESDLSDGSDSVSSSESSATLRAGSSDGEEETTNAPRPTKASTLSGELRNRVLMLTSRGVSYR